MKRSLDLPVRVARWSSGDRWGNPALRWGPLAPEPPTKTQKMSTIAIKISTLPLLARLSKGQEFITKGHDNSNVQGNAALIAALTTKQAALIAANAAYEDAKTTCKQLLSARDALDVEWNGVVVALAAFTESATGGDATKILSAGFDVKAEPVPPQPVGQVLNVRVLFTGEPGRSEVRWKRDSQADAYIVECSQDPITDTSWKNMGTVVEPKFEGNGAIPGQKCWYRVAAVNRAGRGPWSEPALRPVM